eukprot:TRINITY_DN57566_c0_g1_i1.p1 TRINITY_DN57566_c0_g1~~TRINITY_DN57566_c0_g1_i1.p1  ORF type:complete len:599 (+),score=72.83 TRINITY_DN57566_c0_g1_i1:79-1875(+)
MEFTPTASAMCCRDCETVAQSTREAVMQSTLDGATDQLLTEPPAAVDTTIVFEDDCQEEIVHKEDFQGVTTQDHHLYTDTQSVHLDMQDDAEKQDVTVFRTRSRSWKNLPQDRRGISLAEIQEFHDTESSWLTTAQICRGCKCPVKSCTCSSEALLSQQLRMPNLYEVNERMIMPVCRPLQVSYVEFLRCEGKAELPSGEGPLGKEVDTFVSHWWGHEFHFFVGALHRFSSTVSVARSRNPKALSVSRTTVKRFDRTFWICAFANNQFAVEHALGSGDATTSSFAIALRSPTCKDVVAVLDDDGAIYSRIWCAFELFCVSKLVPRWTQKEVPIALVNHLGVVSFGDVTFQTVLKIRSVIQNIKTSEAHATQEDDKRLIRESMERENTNYDDLDHHLVELAWRGVLACRQRQSIMLGLLFGSASPSLAYDFVMIVVHMSKRSEEADPPSMNVLRLAIAVVFCIELLILLASVRGLPRVGRFGSIAHRERFVSRSVLSPVNVLLACWYSCSGPCSQRERQVERRLWYLFLILAIPQLVLTSFLFRHSDSRTRSNELLVVDATSLFVTCIYAGLGIVYQLLRPCAFFTHKRQVIEDFVYAC